MDGRAPGRASRGRGLALLAALFVLGSSPLGCRTQPATGPHARRGADNHDEPRGLDIIPPFEQLEACVDDRHGGCARDGAPFERCQQQCLAGDTASCFQMGSPGFVPSPAVVEVLGQACAADRKCGCAFLAEALVWQEDAPEAWVRGMELMVESCQLGALEACDLYDLTFSICRLGAQTPRCEVMRDEGYMPDLPPRLREIYGCRRSQAGSTSSAAVNVVCLDQDRVSVRVDGRWEQWGLSNWRIDWDAPDIWRADGVEGPGVGVFVSADETRSKAKLRWVFSTSDGRFEVELAAERDLEAERELAASSP